MDIDCPDCGRRVTLDANNIVPYHDNAPPLRSVCSASRGDATAIVTMLATARAEAALAEREAMTARFAKSASIIEGLIADCDDAESRRTYSIQLDMVSAARDAIRAHTTPATLSNDTLAAIAEARGLRVVQPERLAELEAAARDAAAERNACAASLVLERSRRDAHDKAQKIARTETQETAASSVAVAVMAERDACAAEVDAFAAQVQSEIDSTWPVGHKLDQLVAARTVLQKAVAMIRARSNSDRAATASPAPERS